MPEQARQGNDILIWLAAATLLLMGGAWLITDAPWSSPEPLTESAVVVPAESAADEIAPPVPEPAPVDSLYLAQLALDAGMLIEPADMSAWKLFGDVAASYPDSEPARQGLEAVAAGLIRRARSALEQGRYDDATAITETILERMPEFSDARQLAVDIQIATAPPDPIPPAPPESVSEPEAQAEAVVASIPVDPIPGLHDAFYAAMSHNALLTPPGTNAVDIVREMLTTAPEHQLTQADHVMLTTEMLDRSAQAIEALDTAAAQTWIDSAVELAANPEQVAAAQARLDDHLIAIESRRMRPLKELTQTRSVTPQYPSLALQRGVEGWVEVEFEVTAEGKTTAIEVVDASDAAYFRDQAVAAVQQWEFEPEVYLGRPIPQRSFARLVFRLD